MSRKSFENYGLLANEVEDSTIRAGRYLVQKPNERNICRDILGKLDLRPEHSLLDIGCNVGNLTIPLSFMVASTTGLDHPQCLRRLRERFPSGIELVEGNFFDVSLARSFDRILCYSVLHCLQDADEVYAFLDKAVGMLAKGGKALFGDIPNVSAKQRFLQSPAGIEFTTEWRNVRNKSVEDGLVVSANTDAAMVQFDDKLVMGILGAYRSKGFHSYILVQSPNLPFGHTREDILIVRPS